MRNNNKGKKVMMGLFIMAFIIGMMYIPTYGETENHSIIYVSPNGDDENSGQID